MSFRSEYQIETHQRKNDNKITSDSQYVRKFVQEQKPFVD